MQIDTILSDFVTSLNWDWNSKVMFIGWGLSVDLFITFFDGHTWNEPVALAELNTPAAEFGVAISADEQWLHYYRDFEILTVRWQPLLDQYRP